MSVDACSVTTAADMRGQVCSAGGEIASTFDSPDKLKLGSCKLIEEIMIGEDKLIHFSGVEMGEACTIVLRGASKPTPCLSLPCLLHRLVLMACADLIYQVVCTDRSPASICSTARCCLPACLQYENTCLFKRECAPVKVQAGLLRFQSCRYHGASACWFCC